MLLSILKTYGLTARELAMKMIQEALKTTGITATAGIGSNLYLCKVAMDVEAKHITPDKDGVRIAELEYEMSYRRLLWTHRPLTDFGGGRGYSKKLEKVGLFTMVISPYVLWEKRLTIITKICSISYLELMQNC